MPHPRTRSKRLAIAATLFGALWLYGTVREAVAAYRMFRGSHAITIGDGWITLPGHGRIAVDEIDRIHKINTLLHPKLIVTLKRKRSPLFKCRFVVYPHRYGLDTDIDRQLEILGQQVLRTRE